jgi:membrane protein YqaA with SNARE-associated domain
VNHVVQILVSWGAPGLLFLATLDSAGVPMVGGVDALLIAIAVITPAHAYFAATCALAGSVAGSLILFVLARKGGHVLLAKYTESGQGKQLRHWFERYGLVTIFIPAVSPLPLPLKIPVFCAAVLEVRTTYFFVVIVLSRAIRYFAMAYLAQRYGEETIPFLKAHWKEVLGVVLGLCVVTLLLLKLIDRRNGPGPENLAGLDPKAAG